VANIKKAEGPDSAEVEIAKEVLILLAVIIVVAITLSVWITFVLSHDAFGSIYYTLSSLLDVNSEGATASIIAALPQFGAAFYEIAAVELLDGVVKVVVIGFVVAVVINALTKLDIGSKINSMRSGRLKGHIVLCGYSGLGERLVESLEERKSQFVVIEKDATKLEELGERGYTVLEGDFTDINTLRKAGAEKAGAVIFCADSDFTNLMGILAARKLSRELMIISRARDQNSVVKMQRAGGDLCVIPELVAGLELGQKLVGV
jgi:voltage-gated potassium channel